MERWSNETRAFAIETYFKNNDSATRTQRVFRRHFNLGRHGAVPTRQTIINWVNALRTTASATNKKPPGRRRTIRSPENVERVRVAFQQSPRRSVLQHSQALGISDRSVRRILHLDLHFHPYKLQIVQKLDPRDYDIRMQYCRNVLHMINTDDQFLNNLIMTDEAHFYLSGFVNKQNFRYWAPENPCLIHENPLHSQKVTVWCAVSVFGVIGPYFFEEDGETVTVTSERYIQMLRQFLQRELRRRHMEARQIWFQQDGATAHTARNSMQVLREMFPQHVISRFGDINWPARSPDLSAPDYFLWGYLKGKVYQERPHTIQQLKENIETEIQQIPRDMLHSVMENVRRRA